MPDSSICLLSALEEAQLRRLEPHIYHLLIHRAPDASAAEQLRREVETDAATEPYSLLIELSQELRGVPMPLPLSHACHVSVVSKSPVFGGLTRAAGWLSRKVGGPKVEWASSVEGGLAQARRALAERPH